MQGVQGLHRIPELGYRVQLRDASVKVHQRVGKVRGTQHGAVHGQARPGGCTVVLLPCLVLSPCLLS